MSGGVPDKCNVLLAGSGGREHALAWKLRQSPRLGKLWVDPAANAGLRQFGTPCPQGFEPRNRFHLERFLEKENVQLVVVGPEALLEQSFADDLSKPPQRLVFGPTRAAARLEWDKAWCKQLLRSANVPTAESRTFNAQQIEAALHYVRSRPDPVVVKASGLCAGKGVVVCDDAKQAEAAVQSMLLNKQHGDASAQVVIEERLHGQEVSVLALVDGSNIWMLDACQDHKQVGEGDTGPNTGGMGAYCPTPLATPEVMQFVEREVMVPTVDALRREGIDYRGVLFAGLMLTHSGPKVLEFNCRFGDPETQALMMRWQGDLLDALWRTAEGTLDGADIGFARGASCCVVVCAQGYPGTPRSGDPIEALPEPIAPNDTQGLQCFHGGTKPSAQAGGQPLTAGGRVIGVTALAPDVQQACASATRHAAEVRFQGAFFRRDIGHRIR
ncbi:MAG: phosphoribosylamine--glycine ligase [Phycisphaerales bacterium]